MIDPPLNSLFYKKVLLPITVSCGDYCWGKIEGDEDWRICGYFDSEGGHPHCDLEIGMLKYDRITGMVKKPAECLKLKSV